MICNIFDVYICLGHRDFVKSVAISRDGQFIVSASYDKTSKIWDVATSKVMKTLEGNVILYYIGYIRYHLSIYYPHT